MSDPDLMSELPHPPLATSPRERLREWAESLDLSPARLIIGSVALAVLGMVGWRLLAPEPPPPELTLPMVSPAGATTIETPALDQAASEDGSGVAPADASDEVVVHVAGAVHAPGVQRLAPGARLLDAIEAAGGAIGDADLARINMAALLEDGHQVFIPVVGEEPPELVPTQAGPGQGRVAAEGSGIETPVNINTAGPDGLEDLPGVGPAIAQAIVSHRDRYGPFASVDNLIDVRGIGEVKLEGLRDRATV